MQRFEFPLQGSFQKDNAYYRSEDPLSEVWNHIALIGTEAYLKRSFAPAKDGIPWDEYLKYVQLRIQQSLEFRIASRTSSLLTSPLTLYYSFLNLTRAFMALGPEVMPKQGHGLVFVKGDDITSSRAKFVKGTFTDYLETEKIDWHAIDELSLADALGFIIEMEHEYKNFSPENAHVQLIQVNALVTGKTRLYFHNYRGDFESEWTKSFPQLANYCTYDSTNCLSINDLEIGKVYANVANFLSEKFYPWLTLIDVATWYCYRQDHNMPILTRLSYYYIAMFILGSAVRYEPELILHVNSPGSELGWVLRRFLSHAERHFPQLKLMETYKSELYF